MRRVDIEKALDALRAYRGDDLCRARMAFAGLSETAMAEEHGRSGRSKADILAGYQAHDDAVSKAIDALRELVPEETHDAEKH